MNEEKALELIDLYYKGQSNYIKVLEKYCIYNDKDPVLTRVFITFILDEYDILFDCLDYIIESLTEKFNIVSIHRKDNTYLKSYINKQKENGKEIYKV